LLVLLALIPAIATARPLDLQLAPPTQLLGDRFLVQLPVGMRVVANPADDNGLALPRWASTRAELVVTRPLADRSSWPEWHARLVMVAWDAHAIARDLDADVRADLHRQGGVLAEATTRRIAFPPNPIPIRRPRAVAVEPPLPRRPGQPNLIHAAYAADVSGNVAVIAFYAFGDALDEVDEWALIARTVTETLELGSPVYEVGATRWLVLEGASVAIEEPSKGTVEVLQGRDTGAAYLHVRARLGDGPASCAIDQSFANAPSTAQRVPARLLGSAATWHVWSRDRRVFAEAMIRIPNRPRVRFACEASSLDELRALQRVFARVWFEIKTPD
jgi:hypothetical protein